MQHLAFGKSGHEQLTLHAELPGIRSKYFRERRWRDWLRHCTTRRRFRVRFPVGPFEIFSLSAFSSPGVHSASNRYDYQSPSWTEYRGRWKPNIPSPLCVFVTCYRKDLPYWKTHTYMTKTSPLPHLPYINKVNKEELF